VIGTDCQARLDEMLDPKLGINKPKQDKDE
jgi:hypothetical protein